MPPAPMVRPNLTTCFRTKNIEDLENTIIHSFSEVGDWILDICCGSRELSLVRPFVFSEADDKVNILIDSLIIVQVLGKSQKK